MLNPRAKDQLQELYKKGLIEKKLSKAWENLRHPSVHAENIKLENNQQIQEIINQCAAVKVLFNQLVFLAIGYTGRYTDYSEYNFPIKQFNPSHNKEIPKN